VYHGICVSYNVTTSFTWVIDLHFSAQCFR